MSAKNRPKKPQSIAKAQEKSGLIRLNKFISNSDIINDKSQRYILAISRIAVSENK